jgi:transcriptional regulator with XRE-family HTH domain
MTDIGPMLREARMRAGIDVSEVEERTKIRAKYLRALENEEWGLLPGTAYTRGFLRSYAELLGLDARLLVDEYKRQWEEPHELDQSPVRPTIGPDLRDRARQRRGRRLVAGATLVVLALAIVFAVHVLGAKTKAPANERASGLGTGTPPGNTSGTGTTTTSADCVASATAQVAGTCVSLRIEPTATVRACLVADGSLRLDGVRLLAATDVFHARRFVLTLADSAATLVVDGRRVVITKRSGPVRYAITVKGGARRALAPKSFSCGA